MNLLHMLTMLYCTSVVTIQTPQDYRAGLTNITKVKYFKLIDTLVAILFDLIAVNRKTTHLILHERRKKQSILVEKYVMSPHTQLLTVYEGTNIQLLDVYGVQIYNY